MSKLLIDDRPLIVLPKLATAIGLNEAIVLQQIHFWVEVYKKANKTHHYQDGEWWVWNTGKEWKENFPFWSESTVWRALESLRGSYLPKVGDTKIGRGPLVITGRFNKEGYDRTLWYRIDYEELEQVETLLSNCEEPFSQNDKMDLPKVTSPIPESTTEITAESKEIAAKAASETPTAHASDGPLEADISDSTITFPCPNPECEKEIHPGDLKKSATRCPHCKQPLSILVDGDQYGKPPKAKRDARSLRTLGNLLEDCPTPLKLFPFFAGDRKELLAAWRGKNQGVLLQALQWCLTKYLKDGMPHHVCVRNAMAFYRKKVSAMSGVVHVEEKEDSDGGSWIGDDIFNDPEGSDVAQATDDRRARVLVR